MAASGVVKSTGYKGRHLELTWSIDSQSIEKNTSVINWSLKSAGGESGTYYWSRKIEVRIKGISVYSHPDDIQLSANTQLGNGKLTIKHDGNGSCAMTVEIKGMIYLLNEYNANANETAQLTVIPRQATITDAENFTDESDATIRYENLAGNSVTKLETCVTLNDGKTYIANYRPIDIHGDTYTFKFTETERETMRKLSANSSYLNVRFFVTSTVGGKQYFSDVSRTMSIVNAKPDISPTVKDIDPECVKASGDSNTMIKYRSNAEYAVNATAKKHATIKSYKITCGGKTATTATGVIKRVQSGDFVISATDSRGYTTTKVITKTLHDYLNPTVRLISAEVDTNNKMHLKFTGVCFVGSLGAVDNYVRIVYQVKEKNGAYGAKMTTVGLSHFTQGANHSYTATFEYGTYGDDKLPLDYKKEYVVRCEIRDSLQIVKGNEKIPFSDPEYATGKGKFYVNAPIFKAPAFCVGAGAPEQFIGGRDQYGYFKSDDLNKYTTPGTYFIDQNDFIQSGDPAITHIQNCPSTSAGKLIVEAATGQQNMGAPWSNLTQIYIPFIIGEPIYRRNGNIGGTAGNWVWSSHWYEFPAVVEGDSGDWHFRKFADGYAECYATKTANGTVNTKWGTQLVTGPSIENIAYPIVFKTVPVEMCNVFDIGSSTSIHIQHVQRNTTSASGKYKVTRPGDKPMNTAKNYAFTLWVCGRYR